MKVMILYATVEGQTAKIARFAADAVRRLGHQAVLADAGGAAPPNLRGVQAVILAAPVHQRRHPREFEALVAAKLKELAERRVLLLSVSLSAAFEGGLEEAGEYVIEMKMRTGLKPDAEMLVAGAVRAGEYDYFASQVVRHVVLRDRPYDPSQGSHEFTDWPALEAGITRFLAG